MKKQTFGSRVALLRREKGMTQLELAQQMGVTDKAVSKWERDLSFPDIALLPKLAEIFNVTVDELMQANIPQGEKAQNSKAFHTISLALKAVALAMGVAVVVLAALDNVKPMDAIALLGGGQVCLAALQFLKEEK